MNITVHNNLGGGYLSMKEIVKNAEIFAIGGFSYGAIEIIWRQYTHWSMVITGGICFYTLYKLGKGHEDTPIWKKCLIGSAVITTAEFLTGVIVNMIFHMDVWDYSNLPLNLFGQICLIYSVLWALLSIPIDFVCKTLRKHLEA